MIHTDSGKYAIRALTYMAAQEDRSVPASAAGIAEVEGIPPYYLAKVLQDLARARLLKSVRGRGGGFVLKRDPDDVKVLEILQAVENVDRLTTACVLGLDECTDATPCALHDTWKAFRERFLNDVGNLTLADLAVALAKKRENMARG